MKQLAINDWLHSIKVFRIWVKMTWQRHLEYRFDAIAHSFGSLFWLGATIVLYLLVYRQLETIAGWTWQQMILLYGVYNFWWGIMVSLFNGGLVMGDKVRLGRLDKFLLYPGKAIFYSTMKFEPQILPHVLAGLGLFIYGIHNVALSTNFINWFIFSVLLINSLVIAYFVSIIFGATSFWFVENSNLSNFYWHWETLTKYPPSFYKKFKILYWAIYSILPVAFIIAVPTKVLLGKINILTIAGSFIVTLIIGQIARTIWRAGLKNYTGVSK